MKKNLIPPNLVNRAPVLTALRAAGLTTGAELVVARFVDLIRPAVASPEATLDRCRAQDGVVVAACIHGGSYTGTAITVGSAEDATFSGVTIRATGPLVRCRFEACVLSGAVLAECRVVGGTLDAGSVRPGVVLRGVALGPGVSLEPGVRHQQPWEVPGAVLPPGFCVPSRSVLAPGVTVSRDSVLGDHVTAGRNVVLQEGTVVGADFVAGARCSATRVSFTGAVRVGPRAIITNCKYPAGLSAGSGSTVTDQ